MKTNFIKSLVLLIFLSNCNLSFAGGRWQTKGEKCQGLFQKWNYKAQAHACALGVACHIREEFKCDLTASIDVSKSCAYSFTSNGPGGWSRAGSWSKKTCSQGPAFSDMYTFIGNSDTSVKGIQREMLTGQTIINDSNQVLFQNINGFTFVTDNRFYAEFKFAIWLRDNVNDSIFTNSKILFDGGVSIKNGVVIDYGFITPADYDVLTTDTGTYIIFNNLNKTFNLPYDVNSELVQVDMSSDGGDYELYEIERIVNNTPSLLQSENISLTISPYPIISSSNITFQSDSASAYEIKVFNKSGAYIYTVSSGTNTANVSANWVLNYTLIPTGINYIVLKKNGKYFVKTIIK
jgi:hypothetical protein